MSGQAPAAIRATFQRRGTDLPNGVPFGLSDDFAISTRKQAQWTAFVARNRLEAPSLEVAVTVIRKFVLGLDV